MQKNETKTITTNRKAFHEYFIEEKFTAGIALQGTEVKAIRAGQVNLKDSYTRVVKHEVFLVKCHIAPYDFGGYANHEPERERRLLLQKKEIRRLERVLDTPGITLVPLSIFITECGKIKVELGVARGKKQYDKRQALAKRQAHREIEHFRKDHI